MGNIRHSKQTLTDGIHSIVAYSYANETARLAATGFTEEDVYKLAIDLDTEYMFVLVDHSPITWQAIGNDAVIPKLDDLNEPDDNTDLDASTSKHGLLPKLGGGTDTFFRADGTWASPFVYAQSGQTGFEFTTTSATYVEARKFQLALLEGTYLVLYSCEIWNSSQDGWAETRVQIDDTVTIAESGNAGPNDFTLGGDPGGYTPFSGHYVHVQASPATVDFDFDLRQIGAGTAYSRRHRIFALRVA